MSITLHPPAVAQEADWNRVIALNTNPLSEANRNARTYIKEGQSGEAQAYRGYGAGWLATTVLDGGDWANALSGPELQSIVSATSTHGVALTPVFTNHLPSSQFSTSSLSSPEKWGQGTPWVEG